MQDWHDVLCFLCELRCSAVAVQEISDHGLAAGLSECSLTAAAASEDADSVCHAESTTNCDANALNSQTEVIGKTSEKTLTASDMSVADSEASCSRTSDPVSSSPRPFGGYRDSGDSEAVNCLLHLLHGLSHCSYHELSLLVLVDHGFHDVAADLFAYVWHRVLISQQDDKMQACVFLVFDII